MDIKFSHTFFWVLVVLCLCVVWSAVLSGGGSGGDGVYALDVGQGDSYLVRASDATFLMDAGPGIVAATLLDRIMGLFKRHIDVVFISHPEKDHAQGLWGLLGRYDIGVVVWNGQKNELWDELSLRLQREHIPVLALAQGDGVVYENQFFRVLWPDGNFGSATNDNSMVVYYKGNDFSTLFSGDISSSVESSLAFRYDLAADILKVPHHGSKFSSSDAFLQTVHPLLAIIGVGAGNSYGHPTQEVLDRLGAVGATVFRTDQDGFFEVVRQDDALRVFSVGK